MIQDILSYYIEVSDIKILLRNFGIEVVKINIV